MIIFFISMIKMASCTIGRHAEWVETLTDQCFWLKWVSWGGEDYGYDDEGKKIMRRRCLGYVWTTLRCSVDIPIDFPYLLPISSLSSDLRDVWNNQLERVGGVDTPPFCIHYTLPASPAAAYHLIFSPTHCFLAPSGALYVSIPQPNPIFTQPTPKRHNRHSVLLPEYQCNWVQLAQQTNKCSDYHTKERTHVLRCPCSLSPYHLNKKLPFFKAIIHISLVGGCRSCWHLKTLLLLRRGGGGVTPADQEGGCTCSTK